MTKEKSNSLINRVVKRGLLITGLFTILIFLFTKSLIYCIIFLCGSGVSYLGFYIIVVTVNRMLNLNRGKGLFFLSGLAKMAVIAALFILISRYSEAAVLFYMLGLSVLVFSITLEGISQLYRSRKYGA